MTCHSKIRYTAEILMSYRPIESVLAIILTVVLSGCLSVGRSPQTRPAIAPVPSGMPKETTPLEAIIYNSKDDGPAELIKQNETIENMIVQKQQELNALYKKYSIFAINGYGEVEFTKSQKAWSELKELDSLFAGRGEHGSTLARYLYLCEKLRITEDRIKYLKKTFNH